MSSGRFEAEFVPTRRLRSLLLVASGAATLVGGLLIVQLPSLFIYKAAFACLWLAAGLLELRAQLHGASRIERIRLNADGALEGRSADGGSEPLQLLPGSVVLARVAWLRLRLAGGVRYGELLTGDARRSRDWQCLQLVWRQRASIFGRVQVS